MTITIDTDNIATVLPAVGVIGAAVLPHVVAAVPSLAGASGVIGAVLNAMAGNYGAAKNAPIDQQAVITTRPQ